MRTIRCETDELKWARDVGGSRDVATGMGRYDEHETMRRHEMLMTCMGSCDSMRG